MSWFQPLSLEEDYKFELIGLLFGLAVYNGLTLPVTFPKALYWRLKDPNWDVIDVADIEDGWPQLARGLQAMRDWNEGDVGDVFMRNYTFPIDVFGDKFDLHMNIHPQSVLSESQGDNASQNLARKGKGKEKAESEGFNESCDPPNELQDETTNNDILREFECLLGRDFPVTLDRSDTVSETSTASAPMVTNENRAQYIRDYIMYLTYHSVEPQLLAFIQGFRRCIHPKSLSLFDTPSFKSLAEGNDNIDTYELAKVAMYDGGFEEGQPFILQFWDIVHGWGCDGQAGQAKVRKLLEFVTASDRLPVGGMGRLTFVVQRNGSGDERLPTSLTCFGRLLLPQYSSAQEMKKNLERAIEETKGFGVP